VLFFFFFFAALVNQYTTEISFYKREEKEFILLFNKTLSDASHVLLSLLLEAGGSVVSKRDLQQLGNQEESGPHFLMSVPLEGRFGRNIYFRNWGRQSQLRV